ncbi:hypothetical protein TNCV_384511 [Trichonephila clavipes]|nr:hypothetical protein TNCV_384511 [Trichonephila clavipes]
MRRLMAMGLLILSHDQVIRTTPELANFILNFHSNRRSRMIYPASALLHDDSSEKLRLQLVTCRLRAPNPDH